MTPASPVPIGTLLAARWIVGAPLGAGENGEVYETEEAQGGRLCAVKILEPTLRRGGPAWSTFQTEVRTVSALPAEAIARVYDLGVDGKLHRAFVVCERVMFPSLSRYVTEHGPVSPTRFGDALGTIARALDAMHAAGVAHGSLKPQNVFISSDNPSWARLTDYGLARLRVSIDPGHPVPLGWSPPELAPGGLPQPNGDLFSLGLVTFFALTGMPWVSSVEAPGVGRDGRFGTGTTAASLRARELGGHLHPAFDMWFKAALASDPASRYTSASEMAASFLAVVQSIEARAADGPLSGPGVATAIARPLVFLRDLQQGSAQAEPQAPVQPAPSPAPLATPASPPAPLTATLPIGQALQSPFVARPDAESLAARAAAPTEPGAAPITGYGYDQPPPPPPAAAQAAQYAAAAIAYEPPAPPALTPAASAHPHRKLLIAAAAAAVLLVLAAVAIAVVSLSGQDDDERAAASASALPSSPPAPAATTAAPSPVEPTPPPPTAPPTAAPAVPAEPPIAAQPPIEVKPVVAPRSSAPTASTRPATRSTATAAAKPPTRSTSTARPTSKKCGTFINPCK